MLQSISLGQIDLLAGVVKAALNDVQFPKIKVFFNENTETYDYDILEELLSWKEICKKSIPDVVTLGLVIFFVYIVA